MAADHSVVLTDNTVLLRAVTPADAEPLYAIIDASRGEIGRWMPWLHKGYALQDTIDFIQSRPTAFETTGEHSFVVTECGTGRLLGMCGINHIDRLLHFANLGYWLRTDATRRGYMTRAAGLVARHALHELDYQRVEIVAAIDNLASQRVAEKLGAVRECVARNRGHNNGSLQAAVVYSLIPSDIPSD